MAACLFGTWKCRRFTAVPEPGSVALLAARGFEYACTGETAVARKAYGRSHQPFAAGIRGRAR